MGPTYAHLGGDGVTFGMFNIDKQEKDVSV